MAERPTRKDILKAGPPPLPSREQRATWVAAGLVERSYAIELVTPMFGGGARAGRPDERFPVRVPSIRGQLRYWWRLTRGRDDANRSREGEIWGTTENPSPVRVSVRDVRFAHPHDRKAPFFGFPTVFNKQGKEVPALGDPSWYAIFPARSESGGRSRKVDRLTREGLTFRLVLQWPNSLPLEDDVTAAVAAWVTFGGLGARTRRGLGALKSMDVPAAPPPPGTVQLRAEHTTANPLDAWLEGMGIYQRFRQSAFRKGGRGRSRWPEPDSLRVITGCSTPKHGTLEVPARLLPAFPRAVLGLPIVFHFKDSPEDQCHDPEFDPGELTLNADLSDPSSSEEPDGGRMASPVIIRPHFDADAKRWASSFLFLDTGSMLGELRAYLAGADALAEGTTHRVPHDQIVGSLTTRQEPTRGYPNALDALKARVRRFFTADFGGCRELRG